MKIKTDHSRLYFDGNAQLSDRNFMLVQGTIDDLAQLGLTPETAVGRRFTFVQEDTGPSGEPDALIFNGTIAREALGYVVLADSHGVQWHSEISSHDA